MEALILVATLGGPTMFARIGVMRALNRHVKPPHNSARHPDRFPREVTAVTGNLVTGSSENPLRGKVKPRM
jgi:hypothetical protein